MKDLSDIQRLIIAIAALVVIGVILALLVALANRFLKVKDDPRKEHLQKLIPNANCGACGYPGCDNLIDSVLEGKVTHIRACKVIKENTAQEIVDYLNSTPDENGATLKVTL